MYTVNYKRGIGSYNHKQRLSHAHTLVLLLLRTGRVDKGVSEIILFELTLGILNFELYCIFFSVTMVLYTDFWRGFFFNFPIIKAALLGASNCQVITTCIITLIHVKQIDSYCDY